MFLIQVSCPRRYVTKLMKNTYFSRNLYTTSSIFLKGIPSGYPGEGNDCTHQYSYLENSMDGEAWWATVKGLQRVRYDWATNTLQVIYSWVNLSKGQALFSQYDIDVLI